MVIAKRSGGSQRAVQAGHGSIGPIKTFQTSTPPFIGELSGDDLAPEYETFHSLNLGDNANGSAGR